MSLFFRLSQSLFLFFGIEEKRSTSSVKFLDVGKFLR